MRGLLDNISTISLKLRGTIPETERPFRLVYINQMRDGTAEARVKSRKPPYATHTYRISDDFSITEVKEA